MRRDVLSSYKESWVSVLTSVTQDVLLDGSAVEMVVETIASIPLPRLETTKHKETFA
jgi:hypothetical protein